MADCPTPCLRRSDAATEDRVGGRDRNGKRRQHETHRVVLLAVVLVSRREGCSVRIRHRCAKSCGTVLLVIDVQNICAALSTPSE